MGAAENQGDGGSLEGAEASRGGGQGVAWEDLGLKGLGLGTRDGWLGDYPQVPKVC